jgi:hypothetical protein
MFPKLLSFFLLVASFAFADNPNANLGETMANAATSQMINMLPLFILAACIAMFFAFIQRKPKKGATGCGGLFAIVLASGIIIWISKLSLGF